MACDKNTVLAKGHGNWRHRAFHTGHIHLYTNEDVAWIDMEMSLIDTRQGEIQAATQINYTQHSVTTMSHVGGCWEKWVIIRFFRVNSFSRDYSVDLSCFIEIIPRFHVQKKNWKDSLKGKCLGIAKGRVRHNKNT